MDKAIEIMKAAMEEERKMKEKAKESLKDTENIDVTTNQNLNEEAVAEETVMDEAVVNAAEEVVEDEAASEEADISAEKQEKGGKPFFKKSKELAAKDQKIEEITDRLMRTMAEFDNYRKRSEKEKAQMFDLGVKSFVEKLLPCVDNFERGLGTVPEKDKDSAFVQGIEMIYKQLLTSMDEIGVKPIEALGKEFDPNFHNAVMHGEDEELGANIISEEFQKGYIYKDSVVRYSMVKVVN